MPRKQAAPAPLPANIQKSAQNKAPETPASPPATEEEKEEAPPVGMIVAKTEFEGVVKKSFIRLTIVDKNDRSKIYQLYIGDKSRQLDFWNSETIQPGYFFIELPAGSYAIEALSIPVGSTLASELMNITFEVKPEKSTYIGTLNVVGTKEKIKLGGIPVIKPGFDYTVKILDEYNEAIHEFKQRFPKNPDSLEVHLMKDVGIREEWPQETRGIRNKSNQNL